MIVLAEHRETVMVTLANTGNEMSMDAMAREESAFSKRRRVALAYLRANSVGLITEAAVNFVLPYLIYGWAKPHWGDVDALIASSAPPIVWSLVEFARRRRVDALSILVLAGIALSLLAYAGGGGVRMLQLREKLVTALIGCVFLGSATIRRPLIYELVRATLARRGSAELDGFVALKDNPGFRRSMTVMTLVWGFGLVAEAVVSGALVFTMSVRQFLIVGPIVGNSSMAALSLWTFWYGRRRRRIGEARRAAAAAASDA
jgi:hypothetical protein